jgi:hypothetical protein
MFDSNGNAISTEQTLATGTTDTDRVYPSVAYHPITDSYLVIWNTADFSDEDFNGQIEARLLDGNGDPISSVYPVQSGSIYKIADVEPYIGPLFFVSYDNGDGIWGRLVAATDGLLIEERFYLCDTLSTGGDFNNLGVSNGKLFSVWEDERYLGVPPTAVCGSVWGSDQTMSAPEISYEFGAEEEQILEAVVTSIPIAPEFFQSWDEFIAEYSATGGYIVFDIMNETGTTVLKGDISSGEDISDVIDPVIRLRVTFTRDSPEETPSLDYWSASALVGGDLEPPWTEIFMDPPAPDGENGWYISPITVTLVAHDNDTEPVNVTTYYRINGGDIIEYLQPFELAIERPDNMIEFWSIDIAMNEELPHNLVEDIKIDFTAPFITLYEPPDVIFPGEVHINGTVVEYTSGSGIIKCESQ